MQETINPLLPIYQHTTRLVYQHYMLIDQCAIFKILPQYIQTKLRSVFMCLLLWLVLNYMGCYFTIQNSNSLSRSITIVPTKSYKEFNQDNDVSNETFFKNFLRYMKENGFQNDRKIYVSIQEPNGLCVVIGIYNTNGYAGFISIPYGVQSLGIFGQAGEGNYYYKGI